MLNATAAAALACGCGIPKEQIAAALKTFKSVKRRLEVRAQVNGITIIDDFAHHPTAIAGTLKALHARYPGARLWAILEPRSNTLRRNVFQNELARSLAVADEVVVANVFKSESIPESERMDVAALVADVQKLGRRARIVPDADAIVQTVSARNAAGRRRGDSFQRRLWRYLRKAAATSEINCRRRFGQPFAEGVRQGVRLSPRARTCFCFSLLRRAGGDAGESAELPALVARRRCDTSLSLADRPEHLVEVKILLGPGASERDLQLPVWNALYQVRDFSQYVNWVTGQNQRWAAASSAQGGQDDVASRRSRAGRGN